MQRQINASLMVLLLGLVIIWAGCSGPTTEQPTPVGTSDRLGTVTPSEEAEAVRAVESIAVPEWFLSIPEDPSYMYSTSTGSSKDLQFALDKAKDSSRLDIAGQMSTKIAGLFKRFREETGTGEDSELLEMTTSVSKSIVSENIEGVRTVKQDVKKEGNMYQAYVLMELPIGEVSAALMQKVKDNQSMYTKFRASEGFKELESEVEKYEQWKEGQPK